MNYQEMFSTLFIIIAVLVVLVNIITEVAKKIITFTQTVYVNAFGDSVNRPYGCGLSGVLAD